MQTLGPHTIIHVSDDGEEQEIKATFEFHGQETVNLGEGVDYVHEKGEILLEFEDGESRLKAYGDNTLALIGAGIMVAEAYIEGICDREGGSVYRHLKGDVKKPGDMFR